jgi:hypothetical protein
MNEFEMVKEGKAKNSNFERRLVKVKVLLHFLNCQTKDNGDTNNRRRKNMQEHYEVQKVIIFFINLMRS